MDDLKRKLRKAGVKLKEVAQASGKPISTVSQVLDLKLRSKVEEHAKSLIVQKNFETTPWAERYSDAYEKIKPTLQ